VRRAWWVLLNKCKSIEKENRERRRERGVVHSIKRGEVDEGLTDSCRGKLPYVGVQLLLLPTQTRFTATQIKYCGSFRMKKVNFFSKKIDFLPSTNTELEWQLSFEHL
jgi:hypothetical protein